MKVLLVDDDPVQRGIAEHILRAQGSMVTCVSSGEEAVAAVEAADDLDQIFMDMRMPGIGGQEASLRIRKMPGWRGQVRITAMSAAELPPDAPAAHYDGFLPKGPDFNQAMAAAIAEGIARVQPPNPQPPRETVISWLRLNLALTLAIGGLVSAGTGALVTATVRVTLFDSRLEALENAKPATLGPRVTLLEQAVQHEIDSQAHEEQDRAERDRRRLQLATDLGVINARLGVLESQTKWMGDYFTKQILQPGRH